MTGRLRAALIAAGVVLGAAMPAQAADNFAGWYLGLRLSGGFSSLGEFSNAGTVAGTVTNGDQSDEVAGGGAAIGYSWKLAGGAVRTEFEYTHRFRFDYNAVPTLTGTASPTALQTDVQSDSFMANFYFDFRTDGNFLPFIGVGIGATTNHANSDLTRNATGAVIHDGCKSYFRCSGGDNSTDLSWSVMAGTEYVLSPRWGLELFYRYIDLGSVAIGPFSDGTGLAADSYTAHDVVLALKFRL